MSRLTWRKEIKKLGDAIRDIPRRVSADEVMGFCQSQAPSTCSECVFDCFFFCRCECRDRIIISVSTGGRAFEIYLELMGCYTSHKLLKKHLHSARLPGAPQFMDDALEASIIKRERGCFHGLVLMTLSNISRAGLPQTFYNSFSARFHGLSRTGMNLLSQSGFMMKTTSYDSMEAQIMLDAKEKIRSV